MQSVKDQIVLISDNPMTLGVQFLMSHLMGCPDLASSYEFTGVLSACHAYAAIELPYTDTELQAILGLVRESKPVVIGISGIERTRKRLLAAVPTVRAAAPNALVVAGGIDALSDTTTYFCGGVDLVAKGDGELPTEELLRQLQSGRTPDDVLRAPPPGFDSRDVTSPLPAASPGVLPLPYYGERLLTLTPAGLCPVSSQHENPEHVQFVNRRHAIDIYTQRGCTHQCSFCAQDLLVLYRDDGFRNSRRRPLSDVAAYLRELRLRCPEKDFVYFWDLDFLRRPRQELLAFAEAYGREVRLPFFMFVTEKSVNAAGAAVLRPLVDAGLHTLNMGIQSGSDRILKHVYKRNNTSDECRKAIATIHEATRGAAVELLYDVITYNPQETPDDLLATIRLVAEIPADGRQTIRLNTHKLSFNTGQEHSAASDVRTREDYQDFLATAAIYQRTQSPYLSWLLGQMMRGRIDRAALGSVRRSRLPSLLDRDHVRHMDANREWLLPFYEAFVPRESEAFLMTAS